MLKMQSPFEIVVLRLRELGAYQFLFPFLITLAIFYGLLRKSQLFGPPEKNVAINALVATIAAFMVWSYPLLTGVNIEKELSAFMFQSSVASLVVIVGLMIASLFSPPDLSKIVGEKLGTKLIAVVGIAVLFGGVAILFTSGLSKIFFPSGTEFKISEDFMTSILMLVILIGSVAIIAWPSKSGKGS